MAVPLAQKILLLGVILNQLGQRGKLLAAVQVVVVTRVLDLNVGHLIVPPEREKTKWESLLVIMHVSRGGLTPKKHSAFFTLNFPLVNLHPGDI